MSRFTALASTACGQALEVLLRQERAAVLSFFPDVLSIASLSASLARPIHANIARFENQTAKKTLDYWRKIVRFHHRSQKISISINAPSSQRGRNIDTLSGFSEEIREELSDRRRIILVMQKAIAAD